MEQSGRTLHVSDDALEKIVEEGYSLAYGARFLKRLIDERVKLPVSQQWADGRAFAVTVSPDGSIAVGTRHPVAAA
jgi:ATP-dependent Clp protease ATP-binding subunit ClpA